MAIEGSFGEPILSIITFCWPNNKGVIKKKYSEKKFLYHVGFNQLFNN